MKFKNMGLARFNKYIAKYWKEQAIIIAIGLLVVPLGLITPYIGKLVIDKAYGNKDLKLFIILTFIGACSFILGSLANSLKDYLSSRLDKKVNFDMTVDLFRHLQAMPLSYFNDRSTGGHIFGIERDVGLVSGFVCNSLPEAIRIFTQILFTSAVVFYLNWRLALFAFLLFPFILAQPYLFKRWLQETTRRMIEQSEGIFRGLVEVFTHMPLVKVLGKEDYEAKRLEGALLKRMNFDLRYTKLHAASGLANSFLNKVISGAIVLCGGYQIIKGRMTLGSLTAVTVYLSQLMGLAGSLAGLQENIITNAVSRGRLSAILETKPQMKDKAGARDFSILRGGVTFKNICFGYKDDEIILKDINFLIEPAAKIAIVGSSGRGKTTLLSLFLRLYELRGGSISIDGTDIADIKSRFLKSQIAVALQEPFLWNDSVQNNIRYGKEDAAIDEIVAAAQLAEAHGFISRLPQGYDTNVGEAACRISDGQKQRIAIARALISRAKIIVFDEAMSSLDSQTEDKIIDNIKREFKDSTVLIVSHRLSTAQKMDKVYFLESRSVLASGRHDELVEKNQVYRNLFASQIQIL